MKKFNSRNGAFIVSAAIALSTITSCGTNKPDSLGRDNNEVVSEYHRQQLEEQYGKTLEELFVVNLNGQDRFVFSREKLGRQGTDQYDDYTSEHRADEFSGPVSIQIKYIDGQIRVKDTSLDGVDEDTLSWIMTRIAGRKDFILAAGNAGVLDVINIRLNATDVEFTPGTARRVSTMTGDATHDNQLNLVFPRSVFSLSAEIFDQMLLHEASHLLGQAISSDYLEDGKFQTQGDRLLDACAAIRTKSIEQLDAQLNGVVRNLDQAAALAENPKLKSGMQELVNLYADREFISILPEHDPHYVNIQKPQFGQRAANCAYNSLNRQLGMVQTRLGQKLTDDEFSQFYSSDSATAFFETEDALSSLLQGSTIYRYLAEVKYDPNNNFGHGYDNLSEQFATAIALLSNPRQTGMRLAYAPEDERELIVEFIDSASDLLRQRFPQIAPVVNACRRDLDLAIDIDLAENSPACAPGFDR